MSLFDKILDVIIKIDNDKVNNNEIKEILEKSMECLLYLQNINIKYDDNDIEKKRNNLIHVYTLMLENFYEYYTESPFYTDYMESKSIDFFHRNFLNLELF